MRSHSTGNTIPGDLCTMLGWSITHCHAVVAKWAICRTCQNPRELFGCKWQRFDDFFAVCSNTAIAFVLYTTRITSGDICQFRVVFVQSVETVIFSRQRKRCTIWNVTCIFKDQSPLLGKWWIENKLSISCWMQFKSK